MTIFGAIFSMSEPTEEPISPNVHTLEFFSAIEAAKCCPFVHEIREEKN